MSLELKVTTSIAGFGEQSETWVVGPVADREDALRVWQERHELAFDGYDNVGDVAVATEIVRCDEYPQLNGTRRESKT